MAWRLLARWARSRPMSSPANEPRPVPFQGVKGPGLDQGLDDLAVHPAQVDPLQEIAEGLEAAGLPGLHQFLDGAGPGVFHPGHAVADSAVLHGEIPVAEVDVRGKERQPLFPGIHDVFGQGGGLVDFAV